MPAFLYGDSHLPKYVVISFNKDDCDYKKNNYSNFKINLSSKPL